MKKIKKSTYFVLLFAFVLGACGRKDQADAERLSELNAQVESLYNDEMNDLAEDLSTEDFEAVEEGIDAEAEEEFSEENEESYAEIVEDFQQALTLYELERAIQELFIDELVREELDSKELDELSSRLSVIDEEEWTNYLSRQNEALSEAEAQFEQLELAKELVADLYGEDDQVSEEATREDEERAQVAVVEVKHETVRMNLDERLAKVDQVLTEREAEKRAKSIGDFAGYYHDPAYGDLITITENSYEGFVPNSGFFYDYDIVEIIHNSGDEIHLVIYHEEVDNGPHYVPETRTEVHWKLVDNKAFLDDGSSKIRRITKEEFDRIQYSGGL